MLVMERMRRSVVTIAREDSLSLALSVMRWNDIRHLPVTSGGRVVGMLSERDVLRHADRDLRAPLEGSVADAMSAPVLCVAPTADLAEAATMLVAEGIGALPVVSLGELVGILTATDVLDHVARGATPSVPTRELLVDDVMTRPVEVVFADDRVLDAAARMQQCRLRHLPVVDGDRRVIAMISDRDLIPLTGDPLLEPGGVGGDVVREELRVEAAMTREPPMVELGQPIGDAVRALLDHRLGALPVVDAEGRAQGMLSYVDLLRLVVAGSAPAPALEAAR